MVLTKICSNCKNVIESNIQRCPYCKKGSRNYGEEFTINFIVGLLFVILFTALILYILYKLGFFNLLSSISVYLISIGLILIIIIGINNSLKK